jgi:predicted SnoaL-like aldol condensation-catalyzing enzyme
MPIVHNKHISSRFLTELWNEKNPAVIDELLADEYVDHTKPPYVTGIEIGKKALPIVFPAIQRDFFKISLSIEDQVAEGNKVATQVVWTCTFKSDDDPPVAAGDVSIRGISIDHIRDGKIVENWNGLDVLYRLINLLRLADPQVDLDVPAPPVHCDDTQQCGRPDFTCVFGRCC